MIVTAEPLCWPDRPNDRPRDEQWLQDDLTCLAAHPDHPELLREVGISYSILALPNHWDYLDHAKKYLEQAHQKTPNDPLTLAWLGSAYALTAKKPEGRYLERISEAKKGLALINQGVALDPNDYKLRVLRGGALVAVSMPLANDAQLEQDVHVVTEALNDIKNNNMPIPMQAACHLFLGTYFGKKKNDAQQAAEHWRKTIELVPNTKLAEAAQLRLDGKDPTLK